MVDVCVVTNIFRCNADLCEFPRTQEGVFGETVTSAGSMYTLPARIYFFPMSLAVSLAVSLADSLADSLAAFPRCFSR